MRNQIHKKNPFKLLIAFFLLVSSLNIASRDVKDLSLNEDFLSSLPEEARDELLEQIAEDQADLSEIDYGAFSTSLDTDYASKYIKQELMNYDEDISPELRSRDSLTLFGSDFFTGFPTSFMPISEPSLSSDYILDFGDSLILEIYGPDEFSEVLSIKTDGTVNIPRIGKIQVAGLSLESAQQKISNEVTIKLTGSSSSISLESMRDIQVVIVGFAKVPGIYTISGNSTVLSALKAAGGIGEGGSFRNIIVKRNNQEIATLDLYELLLKGNSYSNISLKAGDVILVRPSKEIIAVYGGVKRPSLFEIKNESIYDFLEFAGNSHDGLEIIKVTHSSLVENNLTAMQVEKDNFKNILPKGGDEIYVPYAGNSYSDSVKIIGASSQTGVYSVNSANKLVIDSDLYSPDAYKLAVMHKTFAKNNNKFFYSLRQPLSIPKLQAGDELIVFKKSHIKFLNSETFKDFMFSNKEPVHEDCKYFSYINSIKSSDRFALAESLLKIQYQDNTKSQNALPSVMSKSQTEIQDKYPSNNLFVKNPQSNKHTCIDLFDEDPELIVSLIRNSILVEGKNLASGIYPVASNTPARLVIDYVMLEREFKANSKIALTNNLNTTYHTLSSLGGVALSPGMNLSISSQEVIMGGKVSISGEVNKPGTYFISSQDRLSALIELAGGYKESAYPLGGILIRESAKKLEKAFNEKLYNDTIKNLSSQLVQGENIPFDAVSFVLNEFKSIEPSGRVITEFNETLLQKDTSSDLILEPGDNIHIPKRSNIIYVFGEVLRPGPQSYNSSLSTEDFIKKAGGFTSSVDKSAVIVVYPNGETKLIKFGIFPGNDSILPGSVIYATRDFKKLNNLKLATTLAPIVSSIAISLASLNSISKD